LTATHKFITRSTALKVLITTSGLGSRIGEYTKYINKSLVPISDKPAICHIIESYPKEASFVITLGYLGDLVKQFIEMTYPERDIHFSYVDLYEGKGSSLLYSITCAKDYLQEPFIFHACDTIVSDTTDKSCNWIGCSSRTSNGSSYRSINVDNKYVKSINDKGETAYDYEFVGIFGVKDYERFWEIADGVLSKKECPSDYDVLDIMIKETDFQYKVFESWLDIGNSSSLGVAKNEMPSKFDILPKEKESIFFIENKVIKFFHDKAVCQNRVSRASKLKGIVPTIISSSDNFYCYPFTKGDLFSDVVNPKKIGELLSWSKENLWSRAEEYDKDEFYDKCYSFYKQKTVNRINDFFDMNSLLDKEDCINGTAVPTVMSMIESIDFEALCDARPTGFHGDFILDNMIYSKQKGFTLIDWRQDFAGDISLGDIKYDLSKLSHSIFLNHKILMQNNFTIDYKDNNIVVDILVSKNLVDCKNVILKFCEENQICYKQIEILTSLIWLSMSPLHHHPLDKFLFYFGKYNLYNSIRGYNNEN